MWLPADWVADIVGISPTRYGQWVKRRILREAGYGQCTEAHALEAAVAASLRDTIKSLIQLRIAVDRLRPGLGHPRREIPPMMDVVWDRKRKGARWIYNERELAVAVRVAREIIVTPMSKRLREVRDDFHRQAQERAAQPSEQPLLRVIRGQSA
jgi:hypothetical protein